MHLDTNIRNTYRTQKNEEPGKQMTQWGVGGGLWIWTEFSNEKIKIAKKYLQKCTSFLMIMETQIKTTLRFYLTLGRMARSLKTIKSQKTNAGKDSG